MLTMLPLLTEAVPINWIVGILVEESATPTLTTWAPERYPDPLLPILIAEIVPATETIAVPPAETNGW